MTIENLAKEEDTMSRTSHSKASFKEDYYYYCRDGEDEIVARCSAWTGMEAVYVNDEKVSEFRSLGFNSKHVFDHNGKVYRMMFIVRGMANGEIECILVKGNEIIGEETNALAIRGKKRSRWLVLSVILGCFAGGLGAGYAFGKFLNYLVG